MTTQRDPWNIAERLWTDPTKPVVRGRRGAHGWQAAAYAWPMAPLRLRDRWLVHEVGIRREPRMVPVGHARAVWEHMAGLVEVAVRQHRLGDRAVDTDLEFLSLIGQHIVGCRACVVVDPNRGDGGRYLTSHDVLWTAVGRVRRLAILARALDHDLDEE